MKILLIAPQWMGGWLDGVEQPLRELGHQVTPFHYDTPNAPTAARNQLKVSSYVPASLRPWLMPGAANAGIAWEKKMNKKLTALARSMRPDMIFILKGETLHAQTFVELKSLSSRVISWWLDDPILYFHDYPHVRSQLEYVDILFMFDRGRFQELKKLGTNKVEYLPCAFDPAVYHPKQVSLLDIKRYGCDIGIIASYYHKRGELLNYMYGLDIAVWGKGWKNKFGGNGFHQKAFRGKSLNGHQIATAYNIMKICPNVHHSQTVLGGLNMRTFEIPGAGGFQLTDYIEGMEEHFEIGKEIVVYQSPQHFRELAEYYLKHEDERKAIAKRGYERAVRNHTYEQRLKKIFEVLDL